MRHWNFRLNIHYHHGISSVGGMFSPSTTILVIFESSHGSNVPLWLTTEFNMSNLGDCRGLQCMTAHVPDETNLFAVKTGSRTKPELEEQIALLMSNLTP